jgi:Tfp pilus assembly protein PilN
MAKSKAINLLPQEEFEASTVGRILKWAMSTFRIIVIVTEMVVMAAFLSRFWLDAQNSDLNDSIKIKSAQIEAQSDFEKQFRDYQTKLNIFKQISQSANTTARMDAVASKTPNDVVLSSVAIQDASAQIKGVAGSEIGIAQLIANLKDDKTLKSVDLGQINSSEDNPSLTVFSVKITY